MTSFLPYTIPDAIVRQQSPTRAATFTVHPNVDPAQGSYKSSVEFHPMPTATRSVDFGSSTNFAGATSSNAYDTGLNGQVDTRNGISYISPTRTRSIETFVDAKAVPEMRPYTLATEVASRTVNGAGFHNSRGVELNVTQSQPVESTRALHFTQAVDVSQQAPVQQVMYEHSPMMATRSVDLIQTTNSNLVDTVNCADPAQCACCEGPTHTSNGYVYDYAGNTSVDGRNGISYSTEHTSSPVATTRGGTTTIFNQTADFAPAATSYDHVRMTRSLQQPVAVQQFGGTRSVNFATTTTEGGRNSPGLDFGYNGPVMVDGRNGLRYASPARL